MSKIDSIVIRMSNGSYIASIDLSSLGSQFSEYEGAGDTISEALSELSGELAEAGL